MALIRGFAKIDDAGRLPLPKNVRRITKLEPGQLVEIKVMGNANAHHIIVNRRRQAR